MPPSDNRSRAEPPSPGSPSPGSPSPGSPSPGSRHPLNGIVNFHKRAGVSSRTAVNDVVRASGIRKLKAGHAGTLDPIADGVLIVCLGTATRLIPYIHELHKEYVGSFELGVTSDSDDIESRREQLQNAPQPTREQFAAALPSFVGEIEQVPPIYSAVKIGGERAYQVARRGETAELKPKQVVVHEIELLDYDYPYVKLRISCGTGTYVRSLGRDIAQQLGTAAVMHRLTRTRIGPFHLDDAVSIHDIQEGLSGKVLPPVEGVSQLSQLIVDDDEIEELRHGRPFSARKEHDDVLSQSDATDEFAALTIDRQLVAIVKRKGNAIWPVKSFFS